MRDGSSDVESFSVESSCRSDSKASTILSMECAKRASTKAYQTHTENINMLQNSNPDKKFRSSFDAGEQLDNVQSGESLYKSSNEEDVEKCIAFWKSVMQKNLEPIKCSIIESSKVQVPQEPERRESVAKSEEQYEEIKNAEAKIHEFYKNMWNTTLQEIQRRKLNEIKLIGKSRCKMCESQISDSEVTDSHMKEEIVELNSWEPKLGKSGSASRFTKRKASLPKEPSEKSVKEKTASCVCDTEKVSDTASIGTLICDRVHVPIDTNRYKLLDIISEKKKAGTYSEWRKGLGKTCTCGVAICDCNKNPAILSMVPEQTACGCGQLECHCRTSRDALPKVVEKESLQEGEDVPDSEEQTKDCLCGNKNCICIKTEMIEESQVTLELPDTADTEYSDSITSKETIVVNVGEQVSRSNMQFGNSPIKKDSTADVTKTVHDSESTYTVEIPRSVSDTWTCFCKGECDCVKLKTTEETEEGKEEILQL